MNVPTADCKQICRLHTFMKLSKISVSVMKNFMDDNFLLESETAKQLFHEHAAKLPIIDYHCHLNPKEIAEDHRFRSITEL